MKRPRHSIGTVSPEVITTAIRTINPYHILQVRRDATPSEIRQAYKRLALRHHPARNTKEQEFQLFATLAASYETLLDSDARHSYDVLLKKQFRGEVLVGGKPWSSSSKVYFQQQRAVSTKEQSLHREGMPALVTSISWNGDDCNTDDDDDDDSDDDDKVDDESMALLRQARRNRPFRDPFDVFDTVFGSRLYPHVTPLEKRGPSLKEPSNQPRSAAWKGSTRTLQDGSLVSTTSRILGNRRLTRTEQIYFSKQGGRRMHVMVVSEELVEQEEAVQKEQFNCLACGVAKRSNATWQESITESFDDWFQSIRMCGNIFPE